MACQKPADVPKAMAQDCGRSLRFCRPSDEIKNNDVQSIHRPIGGGSWLLDLHAFGATAAFSQTRRGLYPELSLVLVENDRIAVLSLGGWGRLGIRWSWW